jgi:hypothetical protein
MTRHLTFVLIPPKKPMRTKKYHIYSVHDNSYLGEIKFDTGWRQYTFHPQENCKWSQGCMMEVIAMLSNLNIERNMSRKLNIESAQILETIQ